MEKIFSLRTVLAALSSLPLHYNLKPIAELVEHVLGIPANEIMWISLPLVYPMLNDAIITQHPALLAAVMNGKNAQVDFDDPVAVELVYDRCREIWGMDNVSIIPLKDMRPSMMTRIVWQ